MTKSYRVKKSDPILAWHFLREGGVSRDDRKLRVGQTLHVLGDLKICYRGLHACRRLIDTLEYAPGPVLCRVELWGKVEEQTDKLCATNRRIIAMADVTPVLHEFACRVAEEALKTAHVTDSRCQAAIDAKRNWLRGEIDDDDLAAAREAAWEAARAAREAAWKAAREAAREAAWEAAREAVWEAARAAREAAWKAARAAREAARAARAVGAAAWETQNQLLEQMATEALGL